MSEMGLTRADALDALDRARSRMAGLARKADAAGAEVQGMLVQGATGYVLGKMAGYQPGVAGGIAPLQLAGLPPTLSVAVVGYAAKVFGGGRIGEVGASVANACLTVYAYETGRGR